MERMKNHLTFLIFGHGRRPFSFPFHLLLRNKRIPQNQYYLMNASFFSSKTQPSRKTKQCKINQGLERKDAVLKLESAGG